MGGTDEGIVAAAAGAEAPTGIEAMTSVHTAAAAIVEGMMTGITIMRVGAGGIRAIALNIGVDGAGAQGQSGTVAPLGKVVKRGVQKLSSGTGKRNRQNLVKRAMIRATEMKEITTGILKMVINTIISSRQSKVDTCTETCSFWFVSSLLCM